MKSIELTEKHKEKLLEMCKVLFPEYPYIAKGEVYQNKYITGFKLTEPDISLFNLTFIKESGEFISIHWFEFCCIYLFPKLNQWFNAIQLADFLYQIIGNSKGYKPNIKNKFQHPIDYLYEEFIKNKQCQNTNVKTHLE